MAGKDPEAAGSVTSDEIMERAERVADNQLDADEFFEDVEQRAVLLVETQARRHKSTRSQKRSN